MTVFDELAEAIRGIARGEVRTVSPPVERWRVTNADPLTIERVGGDGDLVLEEDDPDVEIDRAVLDERPAVGDLVRVHHDGEDWLVAGVITHG